MMADIVLAWISRWAWTVCALSIFCIIRVLFSVKGFHLKNFSLQICRYHEFYFLSSTVNGKSFRTVCSGYVHSVLSPISTSLPCLNR